MVGAGLSVLKFVRSGSRKLLSLGERPVGGANPNGAHANVAQPNAGCCFFVFFFYCVQECTESCSDSHALVPTCIIPVSLLL